MQDIRIDDEGNFRCWKCGGKNFDEKRTFRSKAALGVGALLTHKKLKCLGCGEYNDTGNAKPFTGPAGTMKDRMEARTAKLQSKAAESKGGERPSIRGGWAEGRAKADAKKAAKAGASGEPGGAPLESEPPAVSEAPLDAPSEVPASAPVAPTGSLEPNQPLESYSVTYRGGLPDLPKAKVGKIELEIRADRFKLKPTSASKNFWSEMEIPYNTILNLEIVERTLNSFEGIAGRLNSRQLNQRNNIHITYLRPEGDQLLRLEMLSGVTVMGQAKKCNEFQDRLRNLRVREQFVANAPAAAPSALVAPATPMIAVADELAKLAALRDSGVLSAEEFDAQKAKLLGMA
jgi:hypothetical protein